MDEETVLIAGWNDGKFVIMVTEKPRDGMPIATTIHRISLTPSESQAVMDIWALDQHGAVVVTNEHRQVL